MIKEAKLGLRILESNVHRLNVPYKVTFVVSYWCNSRCKHCNIWKMRPKDELTVEEIGKIFTKTPIPWVNLTGGELFIIKNFYEIVEAIVKNNKELFMLNFTTNGLQPERTERIMSEILTKLEIPKVVVVVSLDGDKETHDHVRGIEGNWERAIDTFKRLRALAGKHNNFQTFLGYTSSPYNLGNFEKMVSSVKDAVPDSQSSDIHINLFHASEHYYGNAEMPYSEYRERVKEEIAKFEEFKKTGFGAIPYLERKYVAGMRKFVETGKCPTVCKSLSVSCFIDSWGNVFPCSIYTKKLGNLRNADLNLKAIWNTDESKRTAKEIEEFKCPGCWTPCEAYQTILGNLLRPP